VRQKADHENAKGRKTERNPETAWFVFFGFSFFRGFVMGFDSGVRAGQPAFFSDLRNFRAGGGVEVYAQSRSRFGKDA
jgi:hypothetical protein